MTLGLPVSSVDTQKQELIGPFQNPGRTWRRQPKPVFAHDCPSWAGGRAVPDGISDGAHHDGLVVVGTSHETPSFAVSCLRRWWLLVGRRRYPQAKRLLIEADAGGAHDARKGESKVALQALADEFDLVITVTHYPPGASKWNPIDHRMFRLISGNWAGAAADQLRGDAEGQPHDTIERGVPLPGLPGGTRLPAGGEGDARGQGVCALKRRSVLPRWNDSIWPQRSPS